MSARGLEHLGEHSSQVLQVELFLHNYRYLCLTKCLSMATGEKLVILEKVLSDCKVDEVRNSSYVSFGSDAHVSLLTLKGAFMTR